MLNRKYTLGKQDFPKLRNEAFVYVDKTKFAYEMAALGGYYFLSKPGCFGKSLFISTLESVFLNKKELYEGLYKYDKWEFEEYPIIRISFSNIGYSELGLELAINRDLDRIYEAYDLPLNYEVNLQKLNKLILKLNEKFNKEVVILIDEYYKPIIDYLNREKLSVAKENRELLKSFYSVIKDRYKEIKLFLITGVGRYSKLSIFSDLNNLTNMSLNPHFNQVSGISQAELEANFSEELKIYDQEKFKPWYNGYKWNIDGNTFYNPFSILIFFKNKGKFENYWYSTDTPTFLMKMYREKHFYKFDEITVHKNDLGNFDIENLQIIPLLFQTVYLTIPSENSILNSYSLSFPYNELNESYLRNLADAYIQSNSLNSSLILENLLKFFKTKDKEIFQNAINLAFAKIPYSLLQKENEQYYQVIVHLIFSLLSVYIFSEVVTHKDRIDFIVIYEKEVFKFEFKLDKSTEEPISRLKTKAMPINLKTVEYLSTN